jgi:hypothetical protein
MLSEKLFDLIGRIFFPRQQDWARRRSAKVFTAAVVFGIFLGLILLGVLWMMNKTNK